jgi:hypothetical protein
MREQLISTATGSETEAAVASIARWAAGWKDKCCQSVRSITEEVPLGEWDDLFARLTHRRPAWLTTVEEVGPDTGYRMLAENRPLMGIVAIRTDLGLSVFIAFGKAKQESGSNWGVVSGARHLWLKRGENGEDEALEIEAAGGSVTILRFRVPAGIGKEAA